MTKQSMNVNTANEDDVNRQRIWTWIDKVIIGENFCPFAKVPRTQNKVLLDITEATKVDTILSVIVAQCKTLDAKPEIETSLLACSHALANFHDYLDTLDMAQQLIEDMGYAGVYQLASFHPSYCFAGEPATCPSNYTNRAPLPMFHLIREASITKALEFVDDPESIPSRNIEHAKQLGIAFFAPYLK